MLNPLQKLRWIVETVPLASVSALEEERYEGRLRQGDPTLEHRPDVTQRRAMIARIARGRAIGRHEHAILRR